MLSRKRKRRIAASWGREPEVHYFHGDMEYIKTYYAYRRGAGKDAFLLNDITWNDLGMDKIFARINQGLSTSGEQYLYYMLRSPAVDEAEYARRRALIGRMEAAPALRLKLQYILARLGCARRADLSRAFVPDAHGVGMLLVYLALVLLLPVTILLTIFCSVQFAIAVVGAVSLNALVHEVMTKKIAHDFDTVNYTVAMAAALERVRRLKDAELDTQLSDGYAALARLRGVMRIGGVTTRSGSGTVADMLLTVCLLDLIAYEFCKNRLGRCYADVFAVHETLGRLDAAIAIASYRASLGGDFAEPQLDFAAETPFLRAEGMVHPLLDDAVPNDIDTTSPILITGSNASGKSTFLKTAALCAVLAQSICTCSAERYTASAFRIYSSMALADSLETGESYYIVETRSLGRILDAADGDSPLLCVIDEVLRGTNTVERIAASCEVLGALARRGVLCIAATHDIELCDLLGAQYALFHFTETVDEDEMHFDYRIRPGKATSRNAINLLRLIGFDDAIVDGAHRRANAYMASGTWRA